MRSQIPTRGVFFTALEPLSECGPPTLPPYDSDATTARRAGFPASGPGPRQAHDSQSYARSSRPPINLMILLFRTLELPHLCWTLQHNAGCASPSRGRLFRVSDRRSLIFRSNGTAHRFVRRPKAKGARVILRLDQRWVARGGFKPAFRMAGAGSAKHIRAPIAPEAHTEEGLKLQSAGR